VARGGLKASENVSVGDLQKVPIEKPPAEIAPKGENPLTGQPDPNLTNHLGFIGKFVGGGPEKAGNIAGLVIIASFIVLLIALFAPALITNPAIVSVSDKVATGAISLITGALGYLFGASKS
jgi:hypothetical protein